MIVLTNDRAATFEGVEGIVADGCERLVRGLQDLPEIQAYAIAGRDVTVRIQLGGAAECRRWNVPKASLGFHAVSTKRRHDRKTGEAYHVLADDHLAVVNVPVNAAKLLDDWEYMSDLDRAIELQMALVTVPHEVLHALEWIAETGGMTPDDVYDQRGGEDAIRATNAAIEARLARRGGSGEDWVEGAARTLAAKAIPNEELDALVERISETLQGAAPSP